MLYCRDGKTKEGRGQVASSPAHCMIEIRMVTVTVQQFGDVAHYQSMTA